MTAAGKTRSRRNWAPYILLAPTLIYLAVFFGYPMVEALRLAFYKEEAILRIYETASQQSPQVGTIPQAAQVNILQTAGNRLEGASEAELEGVPVEYWFYISGPDENGNAVEGWVFSERIRVLDEEDAASEALMGRVRTVRRADADPRTDVFAEPGIPDEPIAKLEARTEVAILEQAPLEIWYEVTEETGTVNGWAQAVYIERGEQNPDAGFVRSGDTGQWTLDFIQRMLADARFDSAFLYTAALIIVVIPIQFVLAFIMALVIQARLRGNALFLYVFSIPLGVSELAVGIVWFLIFQENGYINSLLQSTGLIEQPFSFISAENREWIFIAIVLAELWRATSIVMVILVSGLQAVPNEVLEAAELFGANLWQRIRHVILPMMMPSIRVALILRTILAFQVFAVVIAIGGGNVVTTLARETYRWYSGDTLNANLAAAYAGFILILSIITAFFYLRAVRSQQEAALT